MSLSKYQIFLRTVECGSFTKAAESMSFTQSGVSHAVQSLEDELGVCLLSRSRGGVTLTADGRALLPRIQRLCTEHHRLVQAAADLKGMESGLVKVASFSSVSAQWLPLILKSFGELYPNIEFEMLTGDYYDQIESWIVSGEADCGFLRLPSLKGLSVYPLHQDQLKIIVPCGHPQADCNPFPVETIATEPFIRLEEGDDYEIRAALDEMGVHPHVRYTAREESDDPRDGVERAGHQPAAGADGAQQPLPDRHLSAAALVLPPDCHRGQGQEGALELHAPVRRPRPPLGRGERKQISNRKKRPGRTSGALFMSYRVHGAAAQRNPFIKRLYLFDEVFIFLPAADGSRSKGATGGGWCVKVISRPVSGCVKRSRHDQSAIGPGSPGRPYFPSPSSGRPRLANWTRIWCVRPVCSRIRTRLSPPRRSTVS